MGKEITVTVMVSIASLTPRRQTSGDTPVRGYLSFWACLRSIILIRLIETGRPAYYG